jgi:hypothetical protein
MARRLSERHPKKKRFYAGNVSKWVGTDSKEPQQPGWETIVLIADTFGVTTDWLLGRTDDRQPVPHDRAVDALHRILNEAQRALSPPAKAPSREDATVPLDQVVPLAASGKKRRRSGGGG